MPCHTHKNAISKTGVDKSFVYFCFLFINKNSVFMLRKGTTAQALHSFKNQFVLKQNCHRILKLHSLLHLLFIKDMPSTFFFNRHFSTKCINECISFCFGTWRDLLIKFFIKKNIYVIVVVYVIFITHAFPLAEKIIWINSSFIISSRPPIV